MQIYEALGWYWHVAVRTVVWLLTGIFAVGADGPTESQLASRIQFFASAGQALGAAGVQAFVSVWWWVVWVGGLGVIVGSIGW